MNTLLLLLILPTLALLAPSAATGALLPARLPAFKTQSIEIQPTSNLELKRNQPATNLQPSARTVVDHRELLMTIDDNDDRAKGSRGAVRRAQAPP